MARRRMHKHAENVYSLDAICVSGCVMIDPPRVP